LPRSGHAWDVFLVLTRASTTKEVSMEESGKFVVEGEVSVGPYRYPILVDAKVLGAFAY
jgi:hypothetical protein